MSVSNSPPQPRLRLIEARDQRGMSQQDVAEKINTTHVNVSRWERGITKPSPYFRRKLCVLFGKTEEELDLLPSADTSGTADTHATLSPGTPLYDSAIPLQPPVQLVGRDQSLAKIKQRLMTGGNVALTALNGLPGVGKTALSIALAHDQEIREHFRDGVLWAALGPNPNIAGLWSRWGALLGIPPAQMATLKDDTWPTAIHSFIGTRHMLIVIDDAWKLEDALRVKVGGPNCSHLVTTRFPIIASHMTPEGATQIQELTTEESVALLRQLAPQVVNREVQRVYDLVQAVGGLPLALTLIGNYLRKQAYSGPARRITTALERLSDAEVRLHISEPTVPVEGHSSLAGETPLSLQSIIAVTDQQLSQAARDAWYALAVFPPKPNTFSEEAALAVAACSVEILDGLTDTGLLESNGSGYTLHQVIADYARLQLQDRAPYTRLIEYVTTYVEVHKKDYEDYELLDRENDTILSALDIAQDEGMLAELVRIVCSFAPFLILRGFYSIAEHHLKRAHAAAQTLGDNYGLTGTLLYLGEVAQKQGNYSQAEEYLQNGLALARQVGDHERICALLTELGEVEQKQGNYTQAETYLQEGLMLARQIGDQEQICAVLTGLGMVTLKRDEYTQSEAYLQEGLAIAHQINNRGHITVFLRILGLLANNRGNYTQGETYLQEGLALARQIGNSEQICVLLMNMGVAAGNQGYYKQAEAYFREALALARQIGHREWISALLANLGEAAGAQEHYDQAKAYFQEGLSLVRQIGNREWISALLNNLGEVVSEQGSYVQAEMYLLESLTLARQIGRPLMVADALYKYGNLCLKRNQIEAARVAFNEMNAKVPEGGRELVALAQYGLARIAALNGDMSEARKIGELSVTDLELMKSRRAIEVRDWLKTIN